MACQTTNMTERKQSTKCTGHLVKISFSSSLHFAFLSKTKWYSKKNLVYHHIPYETFHNLGKIHSVQTNQLGVQTASACCKTFSVKMPKPGTSSPGGSDRKISSTWSPRVTKDGSILKVVTLFDMFNVQEDCERNPAQFRCSCESTISLYLRVGKTPKGIISPSKMPTARQMAVYKNTREPSCHGTLTRVSFSCFRRLAQILPSDTIEKEVRWYQGGSRWIKVDQAIMSA